MERASKQLTNRNVHVERRDVGETYVAHSNWRLLRLQHLLFYYALLCTLRDKVTGRVRYLSSNT
jgi:hypothetical protein